MATGVADCYYNVVDLPARGAWRFRVACVNKAGQGPYSNFSDVVHLDSRGLRIVDDFAMLSLNMTVRSPFIILIYNDVYFIYMYKVIKPSCCSYIKSNLIYSHCFFFF